MDNGSAPAPWDNPMTTDTTAGVAVGFRTWNATVPPGIPVLCGNTHCDAVAGVPRVSEIPPLPGVPVDSNSVATTAPDNVDTSVAMALSEGAWSPMFSVTSDPGPMSMPWYAAGA